MKLDAIQLEFSLGHMYTGLCWADTDPLVRIKSDSDSERLKQPDRIPWQPPSHQQDDIRLAVLEIALLALLVPNFSRLELVTYIVIDSLVLGLELEKN